MHSDILQSIKNTLFFKLVEMITPLRANYLWFGTLVKYICYFFFWRYEVILVFDDVTSQIIDGSKSQIETNGQNFTC